MGLLAGQADLRWAPIKKVARMKANCLPDELRTYFQVYLLFPQNLAAVAASVKLLLMGLCSAKAQLKYFSWGFLRMQFT